MKDRTYNEIEEIIIKIEKKEKERDRDAECERKGTC